MHVYAVYTTTSNGNAANYTAAVGGHDDKIIAVNSGDSVDAFSIGTVYKF
jgi:hypothetical protein